MEILTKSEYFGFCLSIFIFFLSLKLQEKIKKKNGTLALLANPLLVSSFTIILILKLLGMTYEQFYTGGQYLYYFLTPTTICLAVPLYKNLEKIKKNFLAVMSGILSGCLTNIISVITIVKIFNMDNTLLASLIPKSVTAPIALGISNEINGIASLTVLVVILTGFCGAILAPLIFKIFNIKSEIAQGIAFGTSAHGSGTGVASTFGEEQAAMSGLAMSINGILTVIIIPIVMNFIV